MGRPDDSDKPGIEREEPLPYGAGQQSNRRAPRWSTRSPDAARSSPAAPPGIGRAVALALARAGADVAVTHLSHDATAVVAEIKETGQVAASFQVDLRRSWDVDKAVSDAAAALGGGIDILVNNVGGPVDRRTVPSMDDAHWHGVLDLNLSSAFYVSRAALAVMPDGGRIITIGAQAARSGGGTGMVAYATAKAALEGFTRALRGSWGRGGSR